MSAPVAVHAVGAGFDVVGYDTDARRVKRLNAGESIVDDISHDDLRAGAGHGSVPGDGPGRRRRGRSTSP